VLLISGQVPSRDVRSGYYHENDQLRVCAPITKAQVRVESADRIVEELDRAWTAMIDGRQGPALFEITGDVLRTEVPAGDLPPLPPKQAVRAPRPADIEALGRLIAGWQRPLLMTGGGVTASGAETQLAELARRLGAPVFHTLMGKCGLSYDHPLMAGLPWKEGTSDASDMASRISPLFKEADGLLAIGCRFTQVVTGTWALRPPRELAQIDIDAAEIGRHYPVTLGVEADARLTLEQLLATLPPAPRPPWTKPRPPEPRLLGGLDLSGVIRRVLPRDAIVVADVTRLAYLMLTHFPVYAPRTFLHPAAAVSMGYGLPAALGVRAAFPDRVIITVMGDGCFQMTGLELATAVQERLPVVVILVNDHGLSLIKGIQQRRYGGRFIGVDLKNPDFGQFAGAFGVRSWRVETEAAFEAALIEAIRLCGPALVEVVLPPRAS
jgi:acetolactate synthase-1/2/3 large subunit